MFMKRMIGLLLAVAALIVCFAIPAAMADSSNVVTLNVTNTPIKGDVSLEKTGLQLTHFVDEKDSFGNTIMKPVYENGYLAGAVFEIHAAEDIVGKEGTVFYKKDALVEKLTTSGTGAVKSSKLPLGKYYLVEVSAPNGYVFSTARDAFTLAASDHKTAVVEVKKAETNDYLPIRVTLTKQKENIKVTQLDNGMVHQTVETVAGEGFVFGLYNTDVITYNGNQKLPANTLMATGSTNKNGKLTFSGYYPHGNYYIKEISVPAGWKLSTQKYPVVLTSANKASGENTIVVELAQPILNELIYTPVTLTKKDITGAETLPGALVEVQDSNGKVIYREYTDKNGQIPNIPVVPGTYTFRETYAPEGYALNTAVMTFKVTADGKVTGDTEIRDEINHVYLKKVRENGDGLMGAVFGLFDAKGTKVQEATSDKDGMVTFSKIGYGSYTIKELTAPYGFHPSKDEWKINIDGTYLNPTKVLSTVTNEDAPGQIKILKLDELDKHPIANVQFDIYETNADGSIGDLISTMTTNDEGIALSAKLLVGDYVVKEHENPTGYESTIWSDTITVIMDQVVNRTVTNKPIQGAIRIVKTDSETGKPLAGAQFTITRVKGLPSHNGEDVGEVVGVITSGPDGIAETPLLTWGEYEVKETLIPDDYIDSGYCVTVTIPAKK